MSQDFRHHFLIAMPTLEDSIFAHTLTYICDHNENGAMGVIINQTMDITLTDVFSQLDLGNKIAPEDTPKVDVLTEVLAGGPVNPEQGLVLHRSGGEWDATMSVTDEICLTASRDIVAAMAKQDAPQGAQLILGYAGWDAGQLEQELADNCWLTMPADSQILFDTPIEQRWEAAAQRLGVNLDLISTTAGHA